MLGNNFISNVTIERHTLTPNYISLPKQSKGVYRTESSGPVPSYIPRATCTYQPENPILSAKKLAETSRLTREAKQKELEEFQQSVRMRVMNSSIRAASTEKPKIRPKKQEPLIPLVDRINDVLTKDAELRKYLLECCDNSFPNQPPIDNSHKLHKNRSPITQVTIVKRH